MDLHCNRVSSSQSDGRGNGSQWNPDHSSGVVEACPQFRVLSRIDGSHFQLAFCRQSTTENSTSLRARSHPSPHDRSIVQVSVRAPMQNFCSHSFRSQPDDAHSKHREDDKRIALSLIITAAPLRPPPPSTATISELESRETNDDMTLSPIFIEARNLGDERCSGLEEEFALMDERGESRIEQERNINDRGRRGQRRRRVYTVTIDAFLADNNGRGDWSTICE